MLLCDAPEGLGALDNCLEKSDFFLPRKRFLSNKMCYLLLQKPVTQKYRWHCGIHDEGGSNGKQMQTLYGSGGQPRPTKWVHSARKEVGTPPKNILLT